MMIDVAAVHRHKHQPSRNTDAEVGGGSETITASRIEFTGLFTRVRLARIVLSRRAALS